MTPSKGWGKAGQGRLPGGDSPELALGRALVALAPVCPCYAPASHSLPSCRSTDTLPPQGCHGHRGALWSVRPEGVRSGAPQPHTAGLALLGCGLMGHGAGQRTFPGSPMSQGNKVEGVVEPSSASVPRNASNPGAAQPGARPEPSLCLHRTLLT